MLLAGDEIGHSGLGNNNLYSQDNELSWLNWDGVELASGGRHSASGGRKPPDESARGSSGGLRPPLAVDHATSRVSQSTKLACWRGPASMCWMPRRTVWSFARAVSPWPDARNSITPMRATIQSGKAPSRM